MKKLHYLRALRGALLIVGFLSFLSCDGQITVDDNGNFNFPKEIEYVHDTVYVDKPFEVVVHDTILRDYTDLEIVDVVNQYTLNDTITASSDLLYIDYTDSLQQPNNPEYYVLIRGEGIRNVIMDSTQVWQDQKEIKLHRLKMFGETFYELIE